MSRLSVALAGKVELLDTVKSRATAKVGLAAVENVAPELLVNDALKSKVETPVIETVPALTKLIAKVAKEERLLADIVPLLVNEYTLLPLKVNVAVPVPVVMVPLLVMNPAPPVSVTVGLSPRGTVVPEAMVSD